MSKLAVRDASVPGCLYYNLLNILICNLLAGIQTDALNVVVADDTFPLPIQVNNSRRQRIFNYRMSKVRRAIESAFGLLTARLRIFKKRYSSQS